jgi:hypothetical protein
MAAAASRPCAKILRLACDADARTFSSRHGLAIVWVSDLVAYRLDRLYSLLLWTHATGLIRALGGWSLTTLAT